MDRNLQDVFNSSRQVGGDIMQAQKMTREFKLVKENGEFILYKQMQKYSLGGKKIINYYTEWCRRQTLEDVVDEFMKVIPKAPALEVKRAEKSIEIVRKWE